MKLRRAWTALLFVSLAGAAHGALPDAAQFARDMENGRVDPEQFDFATAGYWQLDEMQRRIWFSNLIVALKLTDPNSHAGCSPEALRREAAMIWTGFLQMAPDAAAWSATVEPVSPNCWRAKLASRRCVGICQADGSWVPKEVEDAAHLDERRAALGLEAIAEHAQGFRTVCPQPQH